MYGQVRVNPLENVKPSPRVRNAMRLYVTGACRTKREASVAAGLHPNYLTMLTRPGGGSDPVKAMMEEIHEMMSDKTIDMSVVIQRLGRMGIGQIAKLALLGGNERIQLDAAKSLADRSPETAGIQKIQAEGLTLGSLDAKALAEALVESARLASQYDHIARDGLIEVDITQGAADVPRLSAAKGEAEASSPAPSGESEVSPGPAAKAEAPKGELVTSPSQLKLMD
jgi:hypothetical protein